MIDFWFSTILGLLIIANIVMSFREYSTSLPDIMKDVLTNEKGR